MTTVGAILVYNNWNNMNNNNSNTNIIINNNNNSEIPTNKLLFVVRHHLHHHLTDDKAFGVSSTLWDRVFNTMPTKKGGQKIVEASPSPKAQETAEA